MGKGVGEMKGNNKMSVGVASLKTGTAHIE
jgi:hypothetical protein